MHARVKVDFANPAGAGFKSAARELQSIGVAVFASEEDASTFAGAYHEHRGRACSVEETKDPRIVAYRWEVRALDLPSGIPEEESKRLVALSDDELAAIRAGLVAILHARFPGSALWIPRVEDVPLPLDAGQINALGARLGALSKGR